MNRNKIIIHAEKTGKQRVIPINEKLLDILKSMKQNGERVFNWHEDTVTHYFKQYLKKSGIKRN